MMEMNTADSQEILISLSDSPQRSSADKSDEISGRKTPTSPTLDPPRDGSVSPDSKCSICLCGLENKSFTDSCFHVFCFVCLVEWSKVRAVCPLCKQPFQNIIHNVRSFSEFEQYQVQTQRERDAAVAADEQRRFRYRTTLTQDRQDYERRREILRQAASLQRPSLRLPSLSSHRIIQGDIIAPGTSAFRQNIYAAGLRVQSFVSGIRAQTSAEFYARNPACVHRLVPWLNRELNVLLNNAAVDIYAVLQMIITLITQVDFMGEEFYSHVYPFLGRRTRHFMHEFHSFARSGLEMSQYDQRCVYPTHEPQPARRDTIDLRDSPDRNSASRRVEYNRDYEQGCHRGNVDRNRGDVVQRNHRREHSDPVVNLRDSGDIHRDVRDYHRDNGDGHRDVRDHHCDNGDNHRDVRAHHHDSSDSHGHIDDRFRHHYHYHYNDSSSRYHSNSLVSLVTRPQRERTCNNAERRREEQESRSNQSRDATTQQENTAVLIISPVTTRSNSSGRGLASGAQSYISDDDVMFMDDIVNDLSAEDLRVDSSRNTELVVPAVSRCEQLETAGQHARVLLEAAASNSISLLVSSTSRGLGTEPSSSTFVTLPEASTSGNEPTASYSGAQSSRFDNKKSSKRKRRHNKRRHGDGSDVDDENIDKRRKRKHKKHKHKKHKRSKTDSREAESVDTTASSNLLPASCSSKVITTKEKKRRTEQDSVLYDIACTSRNNRRVVCKTPTPNQTVWNSTPESSGDDNDVIIVGRTDDAERRSEISSSNQRTERRSEISSSNQRTERKEAERKEAERKEAERKEAERKEAERKEAPKKEAARREAPRKEAPRKEAPRVKSTAVSRWDSSDDDDVELSSNSSQNRSHTTTTQPLDRPLSSMRRVQRNKAVNCDSSDYGDRQTSTNCSKKHSLSTATQNSATQSGNRQISSADSAVNSTKQNAWGFAIAERRSSSGNNRANGFNDESVSSVRARVNEGRAGNELINSNNIENTRNDRGTNLNSVDSSRRSEAGRDRNNRSIVTTTDSGMVGEFVGNRAVSGRSAMIGSHPSLMAAARKKTATQRMLDLNSAASRARLQNEAGCSNPQAPQRNVAQADGWMWEVARKSGGTVALESDDEDVEVVGVEKPWNEKTPILLDSESEVEGEQQQQDDDSMGGVIQEISQDSESVEMLEIHNENNGGGGISGSSERFGNENNESAAIYDNCNDNNAADINKEIDSKGNRDISNIINEHNRNDKNRNADNECNLIDMIDNEINDNSGNKVRVPDKISLEKSSPQQRMSRSAGDCLRCADDAVPIETPGAGEIEREVSSSGGVRAESSMSGSCSTNVVVEKTSQFNSDLMSVGSVEERCAGNGMDEGTCTCAELRNHDEVTCTGAELENQNLISNRTKEFYDSFETDSEEENEHQMSGRLKSVVVRPEILENILPESGAMYTKNFSTGYYGGGLEVLPSESTDNRSFQDKDSKHGKHFKHKHSKSKRRKHKKLRKSILSGCIEDKRSKDKISSMISKTTDTLKKSEEKSDSVIRGSQGRDCSNIVLDNTLETGVNSRKTGGNSDSSITNETTVRDINAVNHKSSDEFMSDCITYRKHCATSRKDCATSRKDCATSSKNCATSSKNCATSSRPARSLIPSSERYSGEVERRSDSCDPIVIDCDTSSDESTGYIDQIHHMITLHDDDDDDGDGVCKKKNGFKKHSSGHKNLKYRKL